MAKNTDGKSTKSTDKEARQKLEELQKMVSSIEPTGIERLEKACAKTYSNYRRHVCERSQRLDEVSTERLDSHREAEASRASRDRAADASGMALPESIFPVDPCSSQFDSQELALQPSRGKFAQNFYKVLVFNHPFGTSFARNGWFLGQLLRFRQEWRPAGFSIGDLVHSTSLAPLEKAVLEVSSWEKTRHEIEEMSDSEAKREATTSSMSTDTSEISRSSASKFEWYVDAHAEVGWGWGSASVDAGASGSSERAAQSMRSSVNEQSRSSANSLSESRSVKVTMSKESGSEQRTVRTLENTNRCHTLTLNLFQLKKLYNLVVTYLDSPLCLILPYARQALSDPTMQQMFSRMNEGLRDIRSIYNIITHYMAPNPRVSEFLHTRSMDQMVPAPFGDGVTVLEFNTRDPRAIREGLAYFFGLVFDRGSNPPVDIAIFDSVIEKYMEMDRRIRQAEMDLGDQIVETVEVLTPALYMESLLGKCVGCEDYITISRSNEALSDYGAAREQALKNELMATEISRRELLLAEGNLEPFEPIPATNEDDN